MKKDIIALVKAPYGKYRLNNLCYLNRWTKSGIGEDVDALTLCFDNINGVNFSSWVFRVFIQSRDYEGIITECEKAINDYLNEVATRLTKDLKAGYRNATYSCIG